MINIAQTYIPYDLDDKTEGTLDDFKKLSPLEQKHQIFEFIDNYIWLLNSTDFMTVELKEIHNLKLVIKHKNVLKQYVEEYFSNTKRFNMIKLLTDISNNAFHIFLSYNFDKNDFSTVENYRDKVEQLNKHSVLNTSAFFPSNNDLPTCDTNIFNLLNFHIKENFSPYLHHHRGNLNDKFSALLRGHLDSLYYVYYFENHLKAFFSHDFYHIEIQNLFQALYQRDYYGLKTKMVAQFMHHFYQYLESLEQSTISPYFIKIIKFIYKFDHQSFINRADFEKLLVRFASENKLETSIKFLDDASKLFPPGKFNKIKNIINDNCEQYQLSNLYSVSQKPAFLYDIVCPENNLNIIFNECNIWDFLHNYLFCERYEDGTIKIRLILDNEISLPPNEVINILQDVFKKVKKSHRKNIPFATVNEAVFTALRMISVKNALNKTESDNKAEKGKKKI